jgi:hypothetical protein
MRSTMRTTLSGAAMAAALAWAGAALPVASLGVATISVLPHEARAGTAIQPGWTHSCSRNPRCFERGEARRRARGLYPRWY